MAVAAPQSPTHSSAAGRRFSIGANVALTIIISAAILVMVNWFASIKSYREDLASFGNYGLSDRTKSVLLDYKEPIEISMVYLPDEEDEQQRTYISRLQDYFDEMTRFARSVKVHPVLTDSQRERLVSRISTTFGSEADKHTAALADFEELSSDLQTELQRKLMAAQSLLTGDSWLGAFPIFASIVNTLRADVESLRKSGEAIRELTPAGGIPKYAEATQKAREALSEVKTHLQRIEERLGDLARLADETTQSDSKYITMLREVAGEARALVASLRVTVGSENDPMPEDPATALKAFADRGVEVNKGLEVLVRRVDEFARRYPMVTQHPNWAASVQMGPLVTRMEVADVLQQAGQTLAKSRLVILGIIDSGDERQLQRALIEARASCTTLEKNATICEELLSGLAAGLSSLDTASKEMLEAARGKKLFSGRGEAVEKLVKQFDELPELKLGTVADQLKQPNIVVIEAADRIRVVDFSEVWPVRESITGGPRASDAARTFNGDSSISSAILAMTREGPFATVVITAFEPPAPPQRNQFMPPPPQSWVPSANLSVLRRRLEAANFKVVDWNMATSPEPPPPEDGIPNVYVCLPPPPPAPPNPFGESQSPDSIFGESQRQIIRNLLDNDASIFFLTSWEVRSSGLFGGPPTTPPYGYGPLLDNDWGIRVDNGRRITWLDPDPTKANSFLVVPKRFIHMPANGFTDSIIGSPMRGTRFLISDACPLIRKAERPEGVRIETVLRIEDTQHCYGANMDQLLEIIEKLQGASRGAVTIVPPPPSGPFDVMVSAERTVEEARKGRIVLMGFGSSVRDDYLNQPVLAEGEQLRLDPPPTENTDLFVNAVYWLSGQPQLISRGPVPVPRIEPIAASDMKLLQIIVWAAWPALVFAPGILLWYMRRQ